MWDRLVRRLGGGSSQSPPPIIDPRIDGDRDAGERDRKKRPPERVEVGYERQNRTLGLRQHLLRDLGPVPINGIPFLGWF
jgi:hypothetical protein